MKYKEKLDILLEWCEDPDTKNDRRGLLIGIARAAIKDRITDIIPVSSDINDEISAAMYAAHTFSGDMADAYDAMIEARGESEIDNIFGDIYDNMSKTELDTPVGENK